MADVTWGDLVNTTATGSTIEKTSGSTSSYNAGALSTQSMSGAGRIEITTPMIMDAVWGFGTDAAATTAGMTHSIDFSNVNGTGYAIYRELVDGVRVYRGETTYVADDDFALVRALNGAVTVEKNTVVIATPAWAVSTGTVKADVSIATINGRFTAATITADAAAAGDTYDLITHRNIINKGALPTLGAAGTTYVDPNFLVMVTRVTDGNTGTAANNRSYHTPSSGNQRAVSPDGTQFFLVDTNGSFPFFTLNRTAGTTAYDRMVTSQIEPSFPVAPAKQGIVYVMRDRAGHTVETYTFATSAYATVLDIPTWDATVEGAGRYCNSFYTGGGFDGWPERMVVLTGGTVQDTHTKLLIFDVDDPTNAAKRRIIDVSANTVNGVGALDLDGNAMNLSVTTATLHSTAISLNGDWILVNRAGGQNELILYNWTLNRFCRTTVATGGHFAMGVADYFVNEINENPTAPTTRPQFQIRRFNSQANANAPTNLIVPETGNANGTQSGHVCWRNAESAALHPVWYGGQRYSDQVQAWGVGEDEIFGMATDGTNTLYRACHTYMLSSVAQWHFWEIPNPQVDPQGEFVWFTSNFGRTLGTDSADGKVRRDVFLVRLGRVEVADPPPPTPVAPVSTLDITLNVTTELEF